MPNVINPSFIRTSSGKPDFVPKDYSEFFKAYYDYTRWLVKQGGIAADNVEDVSMAILTKFLENDVLSDFDPNYSVQHEGVLKQAMFRTFFSSFVNLYLRHYRQRQMVTLDREPVILNDTLPCGTPLVEYYSGTTIDTYDSLYTEDMIRRARVHLAAIPAGINSKCSLIDLFDAILRHIRTFGRPNRALLAVDLGISVDTVCVRMRALHTALDEILKP